MRFSDIIVADALQVPLTGDDAPGVIEQLVSGFADAGLLQPHDMKQMAQIVLEREALGSTALGRGVAIPHAKHADITRTMSTIGVHGQGIDFASLDGQKSYVFFLTLSPQDRPQDHQRALKLIATQVRDETFVRFLRQVRSADELASLLEEVDAHQATGP